MPVFLPGKSHGERLQFMGSKKSQHDLATKQQQQQYPECKISWLDNCLPLKNVLNITSDCLCWKFYKYITHATIVLWGDTVMLLYLPLFYFKRKMFKSSNSVVIFLFWEQVTKFHSDTFILKIRCAGILRFPYTQLCCNVLAIVIPSHKFLVSNSQHKKRQQIFKHYLEEVLF